MVRMSMIGVVFVCALSGTSSATTSDMLDETLAGWSDDGDRWAVIAKSNQGLNALVISEGVGRGKRLATFEGPDAMNPEREAKYPDPEKIDVAKWAPIAKYKLAPVGVAESGRFKAELELAATGTPGGNRYECKGGGWTLKRKGAAAPFLIEKAPHGGCVKVIGGFAHANGKRALVKLQTSHYTGRDGNTRDDTVFVLVQLPPK